MKRVFTANPEQTSNQLFSGEKTMRSRFAKALHTAASAAMLAGLLLSGTGSAAFASDVVEVWKSRTCGCCAGWVKHMEASGFEVKTHDVEDVDPVKRANGVPEPLHSCHTATVGGYVIEGHVPADDVKRLISERPKARGLSVPGMPTDAPGMDMNMGQPYQVILFGTPDGKQSVYANR
jgi:hypothetical protein